MKLTDIGATRGSRAATAKLARQVQKASVAAGKEARTNLEVLGISIGQTQSTGITSQVSEATEHTAQQILLALAHELKWKGELPKGKDLITSAAYEQAVIMARMYDSDASQQVNDLLDLLTKFIHGATNGHTSYAEEVVDEKNRVVGPFAEAAKLLHAANQARHAASAQLDMLNDILNFVNFFTGYFEDSDKYKRSICIATAKQLGMQTP